jgi:RHS repeat-associated protein
VPRRSLPWRCASQEQAWPTRRQVPATVHIWYDYADRWVRKVLDSNGDQTPDAGSVFVYDGREMILQFDKTGTGDMVASNLSHRYLWGTAVDQILADEQVTSLQTAGEVLWPLGDHLGSVRDVIDSSGTVKIHRVYDAFGNFTQNPSTATHLFAFTARPFDAATLLQNNLNRWYDGSVGRWLSEDPIGFASVDANLYRYVRNLPTLFVDQDGLRIRCCNIDEFLRRYHVTGFTKEATETKGVYVYTAEGERVAFPRGNLRAEILAKMIEAPKLFKVTRDRPPNLVKHVKAREYIVDAARNVRFRFSLVPTGNPEHCDPKTGRLITNWFDAIADMWSNPQLWGMACYNAARYTMLRGISLALGKEDFNSAAKAGRVLTKRSVRDLEHDWIPGDWGYIRNPSRDEREDAREGENIIYLGRDQFWGHGGDPPIQELGTVQGNRGGTGWLGVVNSWGRRPAILEPDRAYPSLGLDGR